MPVEIHNKPLASEGLTSYRAKGRYGYIMIGAIDNEDAWREARRSTNKPTHLEIWAREKYVPIIQGFYSM